jgi:hypothetical protein
MHHSLFDRFQGALFGSLLGEVVFNRQKSDKLPNYRKISDFILEILLKDGNLLEILQEQRERRVGDTSYKTSSPNEPSPLESLDFSGSSDTAALASLPIVLFFHDSLELLEQHLSLFGELWQQSTTVKEDLLVWGFGIALILREKLESGNPFAQLARFSDLAYNPLLSLGESLSSSLMENTRLRNALDRLGKSASPARLSLALAFSTLYSRPQDVRLVTKLVDRLDYNPSVTVSLVGALAGTSGGYLNFPIAWRVALQRNCLSQNLAAKASRLISVWAGVDRSRTALFSPHKIAVASSSVIQPRSTIPLISQTSAKYPFNVDT